MKIRLLGLAIVFGPFFVSGPVQETGNPAESSKSVSEIIGALSKANCEK